MRRPIHLLLLQSVSRTTEVAVMLSKMSHLIKCLKTYSLLKFRIC